MYSRFEVSVTSNIIPLPSENSWIIGNIQYLGYYRVNYDERNWNALIDQPDYRPQGKWLLRYNPPFYCLNAKSVWLHVTIPSDFANAKLKVESS